MEDSSQINEMMSDEQLLHEQATNWETPPHVEEKVDKTSVPEASEPVPEASEPIPEQSEPVIATTEASHVSERAEDKPIPAEKLSQNSVERIEHKPISSEKKSVKRKVEPSFTPIAKRRTTGNAKKPAEVNYKLLTPRYKGKFSKQMLFCQKVLRELQTARSHINFTWPFLDPVDVEGLGLFDYYTVVKEPMDFSTMQKKMAAKQYANPEEFHGDMMLIISNCLRYNPEGQPVNKCGKDLKKFFESKWEDLPLDESSTPLPKKSTAKAKPKSVATPKSTAKPKSTAPQGFGEVSDSDELSALLLRVQDEHKRVASKATTLRQYKIQLTELRHNRENAQNEGSTLPTLSSELHTAIQNSLSNVLEGEPRNSIDAEGDKLKSDYEYQFDSDEEYKPMTFKEKEALVEAISTFSESKLARVSEIVLRREKKFANIEPQDLEIDFETLDSVTLREIEAYVKACELKDNGTGQ